ncbi:MAG: polyketide cyclase [Candidatus Cloacimonadota bacterium]|nr:MAG: polyketide cyclase [Candidatus Cloacimonadota bacterium]
MFCIGHQVGIGASAEIVYRALTVDSELSKWWTTDTLGAGEVGSIIKFRFNGHGPDMKIIRLISNKLVEWECVGGGPDIWIGTLVSFQLIEKEKQILVNFKHSNWQDQSDFMNHCSMKWAVFLLSLKDLIEKGVGSPFPDDISINHS